MFKTDIGVSFSSVDIVNIPMLITAFFIVITIGLCSLFMYFQSKKSSTFLKHRLWDKMYIIMPVIIGIFLIIIFILSLIGPLNDMTQSDRWMLYVFFNLTLFLINVTVLAVVHKVKKDSVSRENKITYSFAWTSLGLLVIIFIL